MSLKACPTCAGGVKVVDSRASGEQWRRRYVCINGHRFSTLEVVMEMHRGQRHLAARDLLHAAGNASLMIDAASDLRTIANLLDGRAKR